jgi:prepilin-type N-terminal cleavage/methylation domain-containing protein
MRFLARQFRSYGRHGLTLIETLVVIAVIAIAMSMVLTAFWYAIKTVRSFQGS